MRHVALFLLTLTLNSFSLAEFEIPNEFEDGQVTSASQMNENFQALKAELEVLEARINSLESASMSNNTKSILVGFSENNFDGSAGVGAMNKACTNNYSGSFFCSSKNILESSSNESLLNTLSDKAWVRPYNMAGAGNSGLDISGITQGSSHNSCYAWTASAGYGLTLNNEGNFSSTACNYELPIACCK